MALRMFIGKLISGRESPGRPVNAQPFAPARRSRPRRRAPMPAHSPVVACRAGKAFRRSLSPRARDSLRRFECGARRSRTVFGEARVEQSIGHHQHMIVCHGVRAQNDRSRCSDTGEWRDLSIGGRSTRRHQRHRHINTAEAGRSAVKRSSAGVSSRRRPRSLKPWSSSTGKGAAASGRLA